ncbi:MAG TPA: universal stress protein [Thermoanaerobaculia bacterium]|nr:universal stress protein [Thermoanaerobaculia bacterium]
MYPWRRILIPTDFSTAAEWAFDGAVALAGATGAELVILHIRITWSSDGALRFPADDSIYEYAEEVELEKLRERVRHANASIPTRKIVRKASDPGAEICRTVSEEKADLVVIATHARHHVAHLLIGSTTMEVVTDPPVPVLAIRYGTKPRRGLRRIVVPVHLQQTSMPAAELAARIAHEEGSEIHLVMVCDGADVIAAEARLAEISEQHFASAATTKAIVGSNVERELIRYADQSAADALFINARHDLGGVKQEILRNTGVPVMIVPE